MNPRGGADEKASLGKTDSGVGCTLTGGSRGWKGLNWTHTFWSLQNWGRSGKSGVGETSQECRDAGVGLGLSREHEHS